MRILMRRKDLENVGRELPHECARLAGSTERVPAKSVFDTSFGVPPSGGFRAGPPEGGTPNLSADMQLSL